MKIKRQSWKIREWLHRKGIKMSDLADEIAISRTQVSQTVAGLRNSRRVLAVLVEKGVPAKYLDLPGDMQRKEAA